MKKRFILPLCLLVILGTAMTATHAEKKEKNRPAQSLEKVFAIEKSSLEGLLVPAAKFGVKHHFLSDYGFILYDNYGMLPTPVAFETSIEEDGYKRRRVVGSVAVENRKIGVMHGKEGDEWFPYFTQVVETLSAKRSCVDFEALYRDFGWIVREILSPTDYEERYAPTVKMLLFAYDDLRQNEELYFWIEQTMKEHWQTTLVYGHVGLPDFYGSFARHLSPETREAIKAYYEENNTEYENEYRPIWSYSFWLRRRQEGKTEEVYRTLCAIRDDFGEYI